MGWLLICSRPIRFNTQPPEGGWGTAPVGLSGDIEVSTHSRPKAAGYRPIPRLRPIDVSTHSRPKAAGHRARKRQQKHRSFNTQPPEGGWLT